MKRLTVIYEVPDDIDVTRITGTGELNVVRCEWTDALEQLAEAEAARGIAEQQLAVICEGVNRRCGADNHQLPLVSLDRMLAAHARDRINLVAWVLENLDNDVCLTGDCIHGKRSGCIKSIIGHYVADAKHRGCDE